MWYKTHDLLVKAIALAGVSFMLVLLAILPIYQSANKLLGTIQKKSIELDKVSSKVALLSKLDKNVLAERVNVIDSALPPKKDVLLYLTSIDGLSRELGLTLGGLSLQPGNISENTETQTKSKSATGLQSLDTEIKIQGGRENIYTFLRTIESVLPLMQIKDISVSVSGNDRYTLSLKLGMLWASPDTSTITGAISLFGEEDDKYFMQLASFRRFAQLPASAATSLGTVKQDLFTPLSN